MRKRASEYQAGSAEPFHGPDVEYRLSRQYRRPGLIKFLFTAVLTVVFAVSGLPILYGAAAITGAAAVCFGVSYLWRGRFLTKVTSRGIEVRGYFNHLVPWEQVRDIEVSGFGPEQLRLDENFDTDTSTRQRLGGPGAASLPTTRFSRMYGYGSQAGGDMSRRVSMAVVRADGHKVRLRAPLASGWAPDPDFDDKARQLEQLCARYGRGAIR
jgi:hypothetical protein